VGIIIPYAVILSFFVGFVKVFLQIFFKTSGNFVKIFTIKLGEIYKAVAFWKEIW